MTKIRETDVKDSRGEIVISPGLKVRHKDSQFEYTVDSVIQDEKGKIQVVLNLPDEARFEPAVYSDDIIQSRATSDSNLIYEIDPAVLYYEPEEGSEEESDMISVTQDEFEKDYEVK